MKNIIIVTGGAGFIGSNLIKLLIKNTRYKFISLDNYSTGEKKNHIINKRVKYIKGDTKNFKKIFNNKRKKIKTIFHFAEFSRIYQSFFNFNKCFNSNINGSYQVINFCLNNKIKLIYSATSASLGKNQEQQHLSPYAYTKSFNMNLIMNLNQWKNLNYEIIYFYNVYGPNQIKNSKMSAVIGIFEEQYKNNKSLTVVSPGTQKRNFTHVDDTVKACYYAWKKNLNRHYSVFQRKSYSILSVAKMFSRKIKFLKKRDGERFESKILNKVRSKKIYPIKAKIDIKQYIEKFKKTNLKKI